MIYELGADKALARALAYITGIKQRIPCVSILGKQPDWVTYKFKYIGTNLSRAQIKPQDLVAFLEERLKLSHQNLF